MPPAVNARDAAMRNIVCLPVFTRGSRSIVTPFETASIPVYVPPPIEYARRMTNASGQKPIDAAEVQDDQEDQRRDFCDQLVRGHPGREEVPDLVAGGRDGHGDRENVVDEKGAARDNPGLPPEEFGCDEVSAASAREVLDEVRVGDGNDGDRDRGHRDEDDRKRTVAAERPERLVGSVRRRRETVGPETHPREKRDERNPMKDLRIVDVPGLPEDEAAQ